MGRFLSDSDYADAIRPGILAGVTLGSDAILASAESKAQDRITAFLSTRYNTDALFAMQGAARPNLLIQFMVAISNWLIHRGINPKMIPETVKDDYEDTKAMLREMADGKMNMPTWPKNAEPDGQPETGFRGGGDRAENQKY